MERLYVQSYRKKQGRKQKLILFAIIFLILVDLLMLFVGFILLNTISKLRNRVDGLETQLQTDDRSNPMKALIAQDDPAKDKSLGRSARAAKHHNLTHFCQHVQHCDATRQIAISLISPHPRKKIKIEKYSGKVTVWKEESKQGVISYINGDVIIQKTGYYHINAQVRLEFIHQTITDYVALTIMKDKEESLATSLTNNKQTTLDVTRVIKLNANDKIYVHVTGNYQYRSSKVIMYFTVVKL